MELLNLLIDEDKKEYKCYSILKELLQTKPQFKQIIIEGIQEGKIRKFDEELWEKIKLLNIRTRGIKDFEEYFKLGKNIGNCTNASIELSYCFNGIEICGGTLSVLEGTQNSPDGSHTWIRKYPEIIDTSLMLIIDEEYAKKLGYIEENKYNPNRNPRYQAAKEYANDKSLREPKTRR